MSTVTGPSPSNTTQPTTSTSMTTLVAGYLLPLVVLVGLFVCIILGKVTSDVAVPVIVGIAGVHGGAAVSNSAKGS